MSDDGDPRLRMTVNDFRVVAPNAKRSNGRLFLNGALVIERAIVDSMGGRAWTLVSKIDKPTSASDLVDKALYALLGGEGAE